MMHLQNSSLPNEIDFHFKVVYPPSTLAFFPSGILNSIDLLLPLKAAENKHIGLAA